ncbi:hypothetical protein FDP41_011490 [Naegleria fowleri]|uniref:S phase cyclin A-associated protein in the endoplasmic reticulum N-terminal domain-containing protein n=1 Tax=Naegleria fowleri TaxID=5763 RepID=A0A6A5CA38_NAEFO|nr:uncharacterized protein FDP41_011490 [Naegleria fowleri]KAF0982560.1 hypothetical protein FDP41_011490 [Naegleria fowleri]
MSKSASTAENSSSSLLLSPRSTINNNNSLSVGHTTPRVSNNNIQSQASPSVVDSHQNNNENSRTSGISSAWSKPSSSLTNATKKSSGTPQAWRNDQSSESPSINSSNVSSPEVKINPRETFNKNKGNNYSQKNLHSFRVVNVSSTSSNTSSQVKSPKPSSSNTVKKPPSPSIPSATPSQDENSKNSALSSLTSPRGGVDCSQEMKDDLKRYIEELHRECEVNGQDFTMEVVNILSSTCNELSELLQRQTEQRSTMNISSSSSMADIISGPFLNDSITSPSNFGQIQKSTSFEELFNSPSFGTQGRCWGDVSPDISPPSSPDIMSVRERLSSPSRRKLSPEDIRRRQEEKMARSAWNRQTKQIQQEVKFLREAEKQKEVLKKREKELEETKKRQEEKHERARKNNQIHIKKVMEEARKESEKVEEVKFIKSLEEEKNKFQLDQKLSASQERREREQNKIKVKCTKDLEKEKAAKLRREQLEAERQKEIYESIKAKEKKGELIKEKKEKESAERINKKVEYEKKIQKTKKESELTTHLLSEKLEKKLEAAEDRKTKTIETKKAKASIDLKKVEEARKRAVSPPKTENSVVLLPSSEEDPSHNTKKANKKFKKAKQKFLKAFESMEKKLLQIRPKTKPKTTLFKKTVQHIKDPTKPEVLISALLSISRITRNDSLEALRDEGALDCVCLQMSQSKDAEERSAYIHALNTLCKNKENLIYINTTNSLICSILQTAIDVGNQPSSLPELEMMIVIITKLLQTPTAEAVETEVMFKDYFIDFIVNTKLLDTIKAQVKYVDEISLQERSSFILKSLELVRVLTTFPYAKVRHLPVYVQKKGTEVENLIDKFRKTNIIDILPVLSTMILANGPLRGNTKPEMNDLALKITFLTFRILNNLSCIDLDFVQKTLGETFQTELFHIIGYLLAYIESVNYEPSIVVYDGFTSTTPNNKITIPDLLNEIILEIGYFCLECQSNQDMLHYHNGRNPTLLQRLISLPEKYYSEHQNRQILLPTLICAVFENDTNREILRKEMNTSILIQFIEQEVQALKKDTNLRNKFNVPHPRFQFENRFPLKSTEKAISYLEGKYNMLPEEPEHSELNTSSIHEEDLVLEDLSEPKSHVQKEDLSKESPQKEVFNN